MPRSRSHDPSAPYIHTDDSPGAGSARRTDPSWLIACSMLTRILAVNGPGADRHAVCVIVAPSRAWLDLLASAWRIRFDPVEDAAFYGTDELSQSGTALYMTIYGERPWTRGAGRSRSRSDAYANIEEDERRVSEFSRALWQGRRVVVHTDRMDALPADIASAADHVIHVPLPSPEDVTAAVAELTGASPSRGLTREEAADVTPHLLRLSTRLNQSADSMAERLRNLLARARSETAEHEVPPSSPRTAPDLTRLHGMPEAIAWGLALARDVATYREGRLPWSAVDAGCLLSGPPGTGKTLFARALAQTCEMKLEVGSYAIWQAAGHQGDCLRAMRKAFSDAREKAPSILFVDEIDSFPDRARLSPQWADYENQIVNGFLAEIDGAEGREGVVLIGACNFPEKLDPALLRSGRLDRHIRLLLPSADEIVGILREHLGADLADEDLAPLAIFAAGSSGADCERFVRGARRRARTSGRAMQLADLLAEVAGPPERDPEIAKVAAIHEAGHVVAATEARMCQVTSVSLRSGEGLLGSTLFAGTVGRYLSATDLRAFLVVILAGRAAEEVLVGVASSGAGGSGDSDLARATAFALNSISTLGLDEGHGLLWSGEVDAATMPKVLAADVRLAKRVRDQLDQAYGDAKELIARRRGAVLAVARGLVANGSLDANRIAELISGAEAVVSP